MKDKVYKICEGPFPVMIRYISSKDAWDVFMEGLDITHPYPDTVGRCTVIEKNGENPYIVITFGALNKNNPEGLVGLVVHECVHVFQELTEHIGEKFPSAEFEAYTIDWLVEETLLAMKDAGALCLSTKENKNVPANKKTNS